MCMLCVYTLLKVVSHRDLSILFMLFMSFQKNSSDMGVGVWSDPYKIYF